MQSMPLENSFEVVEMKQEGIDNQQILGYSNQQSNFEDQHSYYTNSSIPQPNRYVALEVTDLDRGQYEQLNN